MSESECDLSVVVAAYNSELYIKTCLDSISSQQGLKNFEIIIVDDGSIDSTMRICQEFLAKHDNVRLIRHAVNLGIVLTRRDGFKYARGRYIAFIDGDDFVSEDHFPLLLGLIRNVNAEVVCSGYTEVNDDGRLVRCHNKIPPGLYRGAAWASARQDMVYSNQLGYFSIFSYLWNKLFRRDVLNSMIDAINSNILIGEDGALCYPVMFAADSVLVVHEYGYHYRQHSGSTVKGGGVRERELARLACLWKYLRTYIYSVDGESARTQMIAYISSLIHARVDSINGLVAGHSLYPGLATELRDNQAPVWLVGRGNLGRKIHSWTSEIRDVTLWIDMAEIQKSLPASSSKSVYEPPPNAIIIIAYFDPLDIRTVQNWLDGLFIQNNHVFIPNTCLQFKEQELDLLFQ